MMLSMRTIVTIAIALGVFGCSKAETPSPTSVPSATASTTAMPSAAAPASAIASASPVASAAPEPQHDCPANSSGVGSFTKPCEAKGASRIMRVKWTKTDDKGPSFSIKNIGQTTILYGRIAVYFYDKSGKQLDVTDDSETPPKTKPFHTCSGSFFQGVMKPAENAVLTFSCVPKKVVPDATATIEAEMQMVGFADSTEKKIDFYWRNSDLTPNVRPKGGVK
jgi:hypothetical protein